MQCHNNTDTVNESGLLHMVAGAYHSETNTPVSNHLDTNEGNTTLSICLWYNSGPSHYSYTSRPNQIHKSNV